jgi:GH25 family lysozyme M1 (1,4-beta-N-acetylmuramidase)
MQISHYLYKIGGTDVSYHQRIINWALMASQAQFSIIRAGNGAYTSTRMADPQFGGNWSGSKIQNLPRGSYWYFWPNPNVAPDLQANNWISLLASDPGDLPLFPDLEEKNEASRLHLTPQKYLDLLVAFYDVLDARFGVSKVGVYSNEGFWNQWMPVNAVQALKINQRPRWVANYTSAGSPRMPRGWTGWDLWQFSGNENRLGLTLGVQSYAIDLNVFRGSPMEFRSLFGCDPKPIAGLDPSLPVSKIMVKGTVNVRLKADESSTIRGQLVNASDWDVLGTESDTRGRAWYRIARGAYVASWVVTPIA